MNEARRASPPSSFFWHPQVMVSPPMEAVDSTTAVRVCAPAAPLNIRSPTPIRAARALKLPMLILSLRDPGLGRAQKAPGKEVTLCAPFYRVSEEGIPPLGAITAEDGR